MQNNYLTEDIKKQLIKILTDEYEKILISETISKSNKSTLQKQEIKEFINYLQNNQNITYADLSKLNEARKAGLGWLGKIGKWLGVGAAEEIGSPLMPMSFDPFGIIPDPFVGPGGGGNYPDQWIPPPQHWPRPEETEPDFVGPPYHGPDDPANQPPQNLPESMKAFWKNRLLEKINYK